VSERPELDARLASMEILFRSPTFTPELVAAIRRTGRHLIYTPDEACREHWERDQNGSCWGEYTALAPLLDALPKPRRVLELGPGLGRSVVFFVKKCGWSESDIHVYDGTGTPIEYGILGPRTTDSFCGDLPILNDILAYNNVRNVTVFNASRFTLLDLPGNYDFIYSFYSVGFHWALEYFIDDVNALMAPHSVAVFTVPPVFTGFPGLSEFYYRIVQWKTVWPADAWLNLLILSKVQLPVSARVLQCWGNRDG
jgi:hypothetical protein